ncbi:hypothetical protein MRB53_009679 [Persea americana]|uniref:Uncharacterized protein n=1 Tax=Persea americana TaxID=3435 RepID=A0ACC2LPR1_PERAE|nr:hypothetical protein MRB53_009679 [Persea americana]
MVDGNQSPSTKQKEEDEAIMYNGNQTPNTNLEDDLKIRNPIGNTDEASTSKQKDVIKEIEEDETDDENDENMEGETDDENGENTDDWVESIEFKLYENKLNSRRQELIMTIPIVPKSHRQELHSLKKSICIFVNGLSDEKVIDEVSTANATLHKIEVR